MTADALRQLLRAQPFRPFDIHLADGRSLAVAHPDFVALEPSGRTIAIGVESNGFELVDLLLVTSLKPRPNGSSRSRRRGGE